MADFIPKSVEGFRYLHGRAPTVAEFRNSVAMANAQDNARYARAQRAAAIADRLSRIGCDCYDEECSLCRDENGEVRA